MEKEREQLIEVFTDKDLMTRVIRKGIDHDKLEFFYYALEEAKKEGLAEEDYSLFTSGEILNELLAIRDDIEQTYGGDTDKCYESIRYNRFENVVVMLNRLPGSVSSEVFKNDEAIDLLSSLKEEKFEAFAKSVDKEAFDSISEGLERHSELDKLEIFDDYAYTRLHGEARKTK